MEWRKIFKNYEVNEYGVSEPTINRIVHHRSYKNVK